MRLSEFLFEIITTLEHTPVSRAKIRHALSVYAPLGTPSSTIDENWDIVCSTLLATNLVTEVDGVFFWKSEHGPRHVVTPSDDVSLN